MNFKITILILMAFLILGVTTYRALATPMNLTLNVTNTSITIITVGGTFTSPNSPRTDSFTYDAGCITSINYDAIKQNISCNNTYALSCPSPQLSCPSCPSFPIIPSCPSAPSCSCNLDTATLEGKISSNQIELSSQLDDLKKNLTRKPSQSSFLDSTGLPPNEVLIFLLLGGGLLIYLYRTGKLQRFMGKGGDGSPSTKETSEAKMFNEQR